MTFDQSKVGTHMAEQMEELEADYGEDCEIGNICTIVEVVGPHGSHLRIRSSDMLPYALVGILRTSERMLLDSVSGEPSEGDGEES